MLLTHIVGVVSTYGGMEQRGWLCHRSNCRELAFALQASANGNRDAEFLSLSFRAELEEVRDKALAREKNKGSGPKATALKTAVDAGASSSSLEPRFNKLHEAKAKAAKAKAAKAKSKAKAAAAKPGADQKALQSKYAAAAESSGSEDGTGSDGDDDSIDLRLKHGPAPSTPPSTSGRRWPKRRRSRCC